MLKYKYTLQAAARNPPHHPRLFLNIIYRILKLLYCYNIPCIVALGCPSVAPSLLYSFPSYAARNLRRYTQFFSPSYCQTTCPHSWGSLAQSTACTFASLQEPLPASQRQTSSPRWEPVGKNHRYLFVSFLCITPVLSSPVALILWK